MASSGLPEGHAQEGPDASDSQAACDLLQTGVGASQARRHGEIDERVDGEGHDEHRAPETLHPRGERRPAEAHDEVGDREGDDDEHRPEPAAGEVGALDAPCRQGADDRTQQRDDHGQPDGVPQQRRGERPPDEVGDGRDAGALRFDEQEDERSEENQSDRSAGHEMTSGGLAPAGSHGPRGRSQSGDLSRQPSACSSVTGSDSSSRLRLARGRSVTASPACFSRAIAVEPSPRSGMEMEFGCSWSKGVSGWAVVDSRSNRVLEADRVGDDLLTLLRHQEGQEALRVSLVPARPEDGRSGHVEHVSGIMGREVGDLRVHVGGTDLGAQPVPVVLVDDPEGDGSAVDLVAIVSLSG